MPDSAGPAGPYRIRSLPGGQSGSKDDVGQTSGRIIRKGIGAFRAAIIILRCGWFCTPSYACGLGGLVILHVIYTLLAGFYTKAT